MSQPLLIDFGFALLFIAILIGLNRRGIVYVLEKEDFPFILKLVLILVILGLDIILVGTLYDCLSHIGEEWNLIHKPKSL